VSTLPFELCVSHYYRGKDANNETKRFHRAIFVITDTSKDTPHGTVFQVIHGRPIFQYMTKADTDITLRQMERYSGKIKIGEVQRGDLDAIEEILRSVEVVRDINSDWNCQAWTREGVRRLVERGFVDEAVADQLEGELSKAEADYVGGLERYVLDGLFESYVFMPSYSRYLQAVTEIGGCNAYSFNTSLAKVSYHDNESSL
jgi:hypothetical protein